MVLFRICGNGSYVKARPTALNRLLATRAFEHGDLAR